MEEVVGSIPTRSTNHFNNLHYWRKYRGSIKGPISKQAYFAPSFSSSATFDCAFRFALATATTTYTYDANGRKTSETDPDGHTTSYTYDAAGNLTGVSGPGGTFIYTYDNARNRVSMTDGDGHTTTYTYDARKRLIKTTYPDGTSTTDAYDGPGSLISVTDQAGNMVEYIYDAANELKSVVEENSPNTGNKTTSYAYGPDGNLILTTDANGHATSSTFDLLDDLTSKTLPDGTNTETRTYDAAGDLLSLKHFNGDTTTYSYNNLNQLVAITPDPTTGEATVSFTYTSTGKRATMTDASGTTTYSYDSLDRLTQKATPEGTLNYTYDAAGNLASMTSADGNVSVNYTWDSLNRLSTVTDNRLTGTANTTTYTYDNANNVVTVTYPNGVKSTLGYDALNRLTSVEVPNTNTGYLYTLGPTGNKTNATELTGRAITWNYDGVYRLTGQMISNAPSKVNGSVAYGLDPVGNRLSAASSITGIGSGSFGYNADDELSTETYDADGNVLASGGKTFAYDSQDRLKSMNGGAVTSTYDGDGNRVEEIANGVVTKYLVDDLNPTGYPQVVEETSTTTRTYIYGLQRIDENQIIKGAWTPSFYGYDGLGNVRQLTNAAGAVTDTYEYDAFGNLLNSTGTTPNVYRYRGEAYDSDLGLYYLRARWMNPITGRFLSRDLVNGDIANPPTLHKYLYADGDPVNGVDPTGKDDLVENSELDLDVSEGATKGEEETAKEVSCVLDTAGSLLEAVSPTPGLDSVIDSISVNKEECEAEVQRSCSESADEGPAPPLGTILYRVWGGGSGPWGASWTTVNPATVENFGNSAGLPTQNPRRFLSKGILKSAECVSTRNALPLGANKGGLPEVVVPNAEQQIQLIEVLGINSDL